MGHDVRRGEEELSIQTGVVVGDGRKSRVVE